MLINSQDGWTQLFTYLIRQPAASVELIILRFEVPCDVNGGGVVAVPAVDGETEVGAHRAQEVAEEGHNQVLPYHESRCRGKRKLSAPLTRSTSA